VLIFCWVIEWYEMYAVLCWWTVCVLVWFHSLIFYMIFALSYSLCCTYVWSEVFFFGWVFFHVFFNVCATCIVLTLVNLGCQNIVFNIICIFSFLLIVFVQAWWWSRYRIERCSLLVIQCVIKVVYRLIMYYIEW
jgi:hypothetical protein